MRLTCRRCLLSEMADERPLQRLLQEWQDALPEEKRADDAVYTARLAHCKACAHLQSGVCALCGCYVELRALKRRMRCPDSPPRWP